MEYQVSRIPKGNGKFREIYIPSPTLRASLRELLPLLEDILDKLDEQKSNYAFQKGRNCALNALRHVGNRYVLTMDLADFFNSVVPLHVAHVIPKQIVERCFIEGHPRQGLPTSPLVSAIAFLPYDKQIEEMLSRLNIKATYTRYADDLIFSFDDLKDAGKIKFVVEHVTREGGFTINTKKTRLQDGRNGRVIITGIGVDSDGLHATRSTKRKIRAALHQGNQSSLAGLSEWAKCKLPKSFYLGGQVPQSLK